MGKGGVGEVDDSVFVLENDSWDSVYLQMLSDVLVVSSVNPAKRDIAVSKLLLSSLKLSGNIG